MIARLIFPGLICLTLFQCSSFPPREPPTYFEIKDEQGRLREKYGNENAWDNDVNFHSFYYYSHKGQLIKQKTYYNLDSTYIVKDTSDHIDLIYTFDKEGNEEKEIRTSAQYDTVGNLLSRDTIYIKNFKTNKTVYPE